ncbi:alpha/beta fold hydrolase [Peribacillus deserti]|uniref:Proline iminopeptidase n=1 Tax=Peribacillus deserti TaxID=673318 RepID=A0A2N5M178_9BACI|nr:alpha/beta hydrolase [Peribacillus deserti]PLT28109.1 proline iminopeptidase [Peribacillus deserti]
MVQISGFISIADNELLNKIISLHKAGLSIDELYEKIWGIVDAETVDLLLFENQEIAKVNRKLWEESNLVNTGLMMKVLQSSNRSPLLHNLKNIKQRALIMTGAFDRNTGLSISKIIQRELPHSSMVIFGKSAHFPELEETEKFVRVVEEFLT